MDEEHRAAHRTADSGTVTSPNSLEHLTIFAFIFVGFFLFVCECDCRWSVALACVLCGVKKKRKKRLGLKLHVSPSVRKDAPRNSGRIMHHATNSL